jgi:glycerophosphoryl diester phosphodiesterase
MTPVSIHIGSLWIRFGRVIRPLLLFELWFQLLVAAAFIPLSTVLLNHLVAGSGQLTVSNTEIMAFFLSIRGVVFLLVAGGSALVLLYAEQVGLLAIAGQAGASRPPSVAAALWAQIRNLPALMRLGLYQALGLLAASLPFAAGLGLLHWSLLSGRDINFYLTSRPWQWHLALALGAVLMVLWIGAMATLVIRWLPALPVLFLEERPARAALGRSWHLTRRQIRAIGGPLLRWWAAISLASLLAAAGCRWAAAAVLGRIGFDLPAVVLTVGLAAALMAAVQLVVLILGKTGHVLMMLDSYRQLTAEQSVLQIPVATASRPPPRFLIGAAWLAAATVLVAAVAAGVGGFALPDTDRPVAVTAHRGSSAKAPENTLSALKQAIADGADYAEIDVQTTKDGVVVLLHDGDLNRVGGVDRKLHEMAFGELRQIDVGSWFSPQFAGERTATLEEAIALARGRIRLNIELKYNRPDPLLVPSVGRIVNTHGFADHCLLTCLEYAALEAAKAQFPDIPVGLIVFQSLGQLHRTAVSAISVNAAAVSPRMIQGARKAGQQVHVWTVNDPQTALDMLGAGVDNIITDVPGRMREWVAAWQDLSSTEKTVIILRRLFVDEAIPSPVGDQRPIQ